MEAHEDATTAVYQFDILLYTATSYLLPLSKQLLSRSTYGFTLFLLLGLAFFALFFRLSSPPMQRWDEARLALNAVEMSHDHQWLVTKHDGQPDLWNTKPPLMIWLQVLSMQALGYSELAVRLPAALAALATVLMLFWYGPTLPARALDGLAGGGRVAFRAGLHRPARSANR